MSDTFPQRRRWAIIVISLVWSGALLIVLGLIQVLPDIAQVWQSPATQPVRAAPRAGYRPALPGKRLVIPPSQPSASQPAGSHPARATENSTASMPILLPDPKIEPPPLRLQVTGTSESAGRLAANATPWESPPRRPDASSGTPPTRLVIPAIQLNAPILPVHLRTVQWEGRAYGLWPVPNQFAAGWQDTSARPGQKGNMVLNGHHNEWGEVFRRLVDLNPGDLITVYAGADRYDYAVAQTLILPEEGESLAVRMQNARWIAPSVDQRLTLVTCWPYESNSHRLIVVAEPVIDTLLIPSP